MHKRLHLPTVLAAAMLLAACGGGDTPAAPRGPVLDDVPAGAAASPAAFTQFAAALPEDDRREPLRVGGLVPPTSETAEPLPLVR